MKKIQHTNVAKYPDKVIMVSDEDYDLVNQHHWWIYTNGRNSFNFYATAWINKKETKMHRFIMDLREGDGKEIIHRDGNSLNNQQDNIQIANRVEIGGNCFARHRGTSKGAHFVKRLKKWRVEVKEYNEVLQRKVNKHIGYFNTKEEALSVYDNIARKMYREYARLNFPREGEQGI